MSSTEKTLLWVGAAVIVVGGAWWLIAGKSPAPSAYAPTTSTTPSGQNSGLNSASDTSDAAINADLSATDNQMTGLSSDSAAINSSLADQPIAQ